MVHGSTKQSYKSSFQLTVTIFDPVDHSFAGMTARSLHRAGILTPHMETTMENIIRAFAGFFVLMSLGLGYLHSPYWHLFTAFVGLNLLQSSFTHFCPLEMILKKLGSGRPSAKTTAIA